MMRPLQEMEYFYLLDGVSLLLSSMYIIMLLNKQVTHVDTVTWAGCISTVVSW